MLFIIVIFLKAHKAKVQEMKIKTFSLNERVNTLYALTECPYKRKTATKEITNQILSTTWPWGDLLVGLAVRQERPWPKDQSFWSWPTPLFLWP